MDLLKRELQKKKQILAEDFGGKKLLKRSDIDRLKIQKLRDEEQLELRAKKSLRPQSTTTTNPNPNSLSSLPPALSSAAATTTSEPSSDLRIDDLVLPRPEVIRRLRFLKQPITLFGEDDDARLDRLKLALKSGVLEVDDEMTQGQTNDFLRDIDELRKRQKAGFHGKKRKKDDPEREDDGTNGGDLDEKDLSGDGGSSGMDADKDVKRMKTKFDDLCDEDKILVFFKKLLNEWNQELYEMPDAEKRTAKGKSMVATYKQCARYLHPLFKFCRKKVRTPRERLRIVLSQQVVSELWLIRSDR